MDFSSFCDDRNPITRSSQNDENPSNMSPNICSIRNTYWSIWVSLWAMIFSKYCNFQFFDPFSWFSTTYIDLKWQNQQFFGKKFLGIPQNWSILLNVSLVCVLLVQNKFKVCLRAGSTDKYRDFTITQLLLVELLSIEEDGTGACSWVFRTPKFPFDGLLSAPGLWVKYTSVTSSMINVVRDYNSMSQNLKKV